MNYRISKYAIVLKIKIYLFCNTKILVNSKLGWLATHSKILIYIMFGYDLVIENYSENWYLLKKKNELKHWKTI